MSEIPPPQYTPQPVSGVHEPPDRPNPLYLVLLAIAAVTAVVALVVFDNNENDATTTVEVSQAPDDAANTSTTTASTTATTAPSGSASVAIVKEIQTDLTTLGYYSGPIDGNYGTETTDAVKAFQTDAGLTPDGRYGPETHAAVQAALGDEQSGTVVQIQTALKDLGWYEGEIDGDYGPQTIQAVKDIQTFLGVTADGIVGPETLAAYDAQCGADPSVCAKPADSGTTTTTVTSGGLEGLTPEQQATVDACAGGDIAACTTARTFLTDGHYSAINAQCAAGDTTACALQTNLATAELQELCEGGDQEACDQLPDA
jgi:peptidoglycan hydrolase-like protein with peptidoglycan-binding domain